MRLFTTQALLAAALVLAPTSGTGAQRVAHRLFEASGSSGSSIPGTVAGTAAGPCRSRVRVDSARRASPWAVLASATLPGSGQAVLRQDRLIAYLAIEAYSWARYAADLRDGRRARSAYRNLAGEVARRPFSTTRPIGDFDYYERMEKFAESGAFDAIPGGSLDPEPDTSTANGATWLLARQTYWEDPWAPPAAESPEYRRAESFYRERAVPAEYRWSWANARLEYAEFRRTIHRSNNAFRNSLQDLGLVIANHALSTVDAFITVRLRRNTAAGARRYGLSASVPFGGPPRRGE